MSAPARGYPVFGHRWIFPSTLLANGKARAPDYTPFIDPEMADDPWPVSPNYHPEIFYPPIALVAPQRPFNFADFASVSRLGFIFGSVHFYRRSVRSLGNIRRLCSPD